MLKKLTLTIDEKIYEGLQKIIGPRKISRFIEDLVRPHVIRSELYLAYKQMAEDKSRESDAQEWAESTVGDISDDVAR